MSVWDIILGRYFGMMLQKFVMILGKKQKNLLWIFFNEHTQPFLTLNLPQKNITNNHNKFSSQNFVTSSKNNVPKFHPKRHEQGYKVLKIYSFLSLTNYCGFERRRKIKS